MTVVGKRREAVRGSNAFLRISVRRSEDNINVSEHRLLLGRGVLNGK